MMARPVHPVTLVSKQLAQHIARVRKGTTGQREEKKTRARPVAETRRQTHSRMFLCFCRPERWSTVTEELGGSLRSAGTLQETKWGPAPLMDQYVPAGPEGCRFFSSQSLTISLLSPCLCPLGFLFHLRPPLSSPHLLGVFHSSSSSTL